VFQAKYMSGGTVKGHDITVSSGECVVLQNVDVPISVESGGEIGIIEELPTKTMLFNELSYFDNLCFLLDRRLPAIWRDGNLREGVRREYAAILGDDVFDMRVDALTEEQKYYLVYTRIALQNPKVVFCVQPFRQADMELRIHIMELMRMLLDKGMALVILTVNLADSLSLADRLIRIHRDKPVEIYTRSEFSEMPVSAPWTGLHREPR